MVDALLGDDPTQSYEKNTKKTYLRFHRFCYKNLLTINFFQIICHNYLLFLHIIVWLNNVSMIVNWFSEIKSGKFAQIFRFFYNLIFSFHNPWLFTFACMHACMYGLWYIGLHVKHSKNLGEHAAVTRTWFVVLKPGGQQCISMYFLTKPVRVNEDKWYPNIDIPLHPNLFM